MGRNDAYPIRGDRKLANTHNSDHSSSRVCLEIQEEKKKKLFISQRVIKEETKKKKKTAYFRPVNKNKLTLLYYFPRIDDIILR